MNKAYQFTSVDVKEALIEIVYQRTGERINFDQRIEFLNRDLKDIEIALVQLSKVISL